MCLFCSFRSSFQNSACSFRKQRNCRYSNFPYFSGFLRCNRQISLKYQAFRQIQSRPKPPSKITKQPLTHKTRNAVGREFPGARVQISSSPPPYRSKVCFAPILFFLHYSLLSAISHLLVKLPLSGNSSPVSIACAEVILEL